MVLRNAVVAAAAFVRFGACGRPQNTPWQPPVATSAADEARRVHKGAVSPKVTDSPMPPFASMEDLRRDLVISSNTCGFFTNGNSALTCSIGETCTNSGHYRDCCSGTACGVSSFSTACLDGTAAACSQSGGPGPGTYCCNYQANYPYCVTFFWATSTDPNNIFTLFNCDSSQFAGQEILLNSPTPTSTSTRSTTTSTTTTSSTTSSSSTTTTSSTSTTSADSGGGGSSAPVGAIVGGVVGGLAVIGIVAVLVVWMVVRKRRQQREETQTAAAAGGAQPQYPQQQYPGGPPVGGMVDYRHNSQYAPSMATSQDPKPAMYDPRYSIAQPHNGTSPVHSGMPSPGSQPAVMPAAGYPGGHQEYFAPSSEGYQQSGIPPSHSPHSPSAIGQSPGVGQPGYEAERHELGS